MNAAYFQRMIDYTYWAHRLVWTCIAELNEEQFRRPCDYSIGSVHKQVVHTMDVERLWLDRVRAMQPAASLTPGDFPTREAIRARWDQVETGWREFIAALRDDQLDQPIRYVSLHENIGREQPLWEGLAQTINHATDHRAQTLAVIHRVGGRTLEQDFVLYSWENPQDEASS